MIKLNFGEKILESAAPVTVYEAAKEAELISRAVIAAEVDGEVKALSYLVEADADVKLLTFADEEGKHVFRHTASHVLAQACPFLLMGIDTVSYTGCFVIVFKLCFHFILLAVTL